MILLDNDDKDDNDLSEKNPTLKERRDGG